MLTATLKLRIKQTVLALRIYLKQNPNDCKKTKDMSLNEIRRKPKASESLGVAR